MPNNKSKQSKPSPRKSRGKSVAVAYGSKTTASQPRFYMRGDKICVHHREYVQDIFSDSTNEFAYDVFQISPSNATLHPWLAAIAQNFESSRYLAFASVFKTACSSTQAGKLIMGVDYDADDPDTAVTKADLLQWVGTSSENYWRDSRMVCSQKGLNLLGPMKFNQDGNPTSDSRLDTSGLLYVATTTSNLTVSGLDFVQANFGELWVEYDVELGFPTVDNSLYTTALRPQMEQRAVVNSVLSASTNLLAGTTPASTPTTTEFLEPYGIKLVDAGTNEYLKAGSATTYAPNGTPLLVFEKDFQGPFSILVTGAASSVSSSPLSVDQYTRVSGNGDRGDDVDFAGNTVSVLNESTNFSSPGLNYTVNGFIRAAKGTALRLLGSAISATATNIVKNLIFSSANVYRPKGDLLANERNLLKAETQCSSTTSAITF